MGLLDRAISFGKRVYGAVFGGNDDSKHKPAPTSSARRTSTGAKDNKKPTQNAQSTSPKPTLPLVSKEKVPQNVDTLTNKKTKHIAPKNIDKKTQNNQKIKTDNNSQENLKVQVYIKGQEIQKKCKNAGLSKDLVNAAILSRIGFSREEFQNMPLDDQLKVLECIDSSIDSLIEIKNQNGISDDVNTNEYVATTACNIYEAKEEGLITHRKQYRKMVGNIHASLGKDFVKLSEEEKYQRVNDLYSEYSKEIDLKEQVELSHCKTEEEKSRVRAKFEKRREITERQHMGDMLAIYGGKELPRAVMFANGRRFGANLQYGMSMLKESAKTEAADAFTNNVLMDNVRRLNARGELPDANSLGDATETITSYMSYDSLRQFEQDNAEYRRKIENGEISAPYLTKDHLNQMTLAVGKGATLNANLTTEQKTELLNNWKEHVSKLNLSDSNKIKSEYEKFVNDYIKTHPKKANEIAEIKVILEDKYKKELFKPQNTVAEVAVKTAKMSRNIYSPKEENKDSALCTNPVKAENAAAKAKSEELQIALKTMQFEDAKKVFNKNSLYDLVSAVYKGGLKQHWIATTQFLKTADINEICRASEGCDGDTLAFIMRNIPTDKAAKFGELKSKDLCYAQRQLVENILEG